MINIIVSYILIVGSFNSSTAAIKNDTKWFNLAIKYAVKNKKPLILTSGKTYYLDNLDKILLKENESLEIKGHKNTLIYTSSSNKQLSSLFDIEAKDTNHSTFQMTGLTIDGKSNRVQFFQKKFEDLRLCIGVTTVGVSNVSIVFVNFKNLYGGGIKTNIFRSFKANYVNFSNVGGKWPHGDGNDSFGDGIYLGYAAQNAVANISNCLITGYSDKINFGGFYKNLSRAGVVAEFNKFSHLDLTISNTKFTGYQRSIHLEGSNTSLKVNNCTFNRYICGVFVFGYEAKDVYVINSSFMQVYDKGAFGGAKGVVTGYANNNQAFLTGCRINNPKYYRENEMKATFTNCVLKFEQYTPPSRASVFRNCTFQTTSPIVASFGKILKN